VLATGAVPQALIAAGLCERRTPSGVALRGYVKNEAMVGRIEQLQIVWHRRLAGGYGWIFPAPDGVFNIGAGLTGSHDVQGGRFGMRSVNLREMFDAFCEVHAPARELMDGGTLLGELKGAPLRCSLTARAGRGPACWPPAKRRAAPMPSPARASARPWRPACSPPRPLLQQARGGADAALCERLRSVAAGAAAPLRLYEKASRQPPPLADRPRDLARPPQRRASCAA
jgi:menaquinone-9 beta-reductase